MSKLKIIGIVVLCIIAALLLIFSNNVQVKAVDESYERQSLGLLKDLEAGNYDKLENFFHKAHVEHQKFQQGRNVAYSVFSSWYTSNYHVNPQMLEHINGWIAKYPDSPFAYLARAEFYYRQGWKSRGEKWASLTTNDQWQGYYKGLGMAHADLTKQVLPRDSKIAYAYELLIAIMGQTNGYFDDESKNMESEQFLKAIMDTVSQGYVAKQKELQLVDMAKSQKMDDMFGVHYAYMIFALSPRWGGSNDQMLAYAREVSKDVPEDSTLPMLVVLAHKEVARALSAKDRKAYYERSGVWDEIESAFNRVNAAYPQGAQWMVRYAEVANDAGKYDVAGAYINRAYYTDPNYTPTYLKIGEMYMQDSSHYKDAEKTYKEFLAIRHDDPEPYRQLAYMRIKQKEYDEAIAYADQGIALDPNVCILWAHRCLANYEKGDYQQGLKDCTHIIDVDPYCALAYKHRAKINTALGQKDAADIDQRIYEQIDGK